jgi:hypothetical protein
VCDEARATGACRIRRVHGWRQEIPNAPGGQPGDSQFLEAKLKWLNLIFDSHAWFYFLGFVGGFGVGSIWISRQWQAQLLLEREWLRKLVLNPNEFGALMMEAKIRALKKERVH